MTHRNQPPARPAGRVLAPRREQGGWLLGCGIALGVVLLIVIIGCVVVALKWKSWGGGLFETGMHQMLDESSLPDDQKDALKDRVTLLKDEFIAGDITLEDAEKIGKALEGSPLLYAGGVQVAIDAYINTSGLPSEAKADGVRQMQRLARGLFDGTIDESQLESILEHIGTKKGENNWEFKKPEEVSDAEIQAMIDDARAAADAADVPDEEWTIDFVAEFDRVMEEALGRPLGG